jgi:hypothetical protein
LAAARCVQVVRLWSGARSSPARPSVRHPRVALGALRLALGVLADLDRGVNLAKLAV